MREILFRGKRKNLFPKKLQSIIRCRAIDILVSEYGSDIAIPVDYMDNIDNVIKFADEYGCTVDYLLGRTDTPYYTL